MTEQEMRDMKAPTPKSREELNEYLNKLEDEDLDYGKCVYVMSLGATATFNYLAHKIGVTGFQASCADLDILRRTRSMDRFMIVNLENALYPQYDLVAKLNKYLEDNKDYLAERATELLTSIEPAHPEVINHWKRLAKSV